MLKDVLKQIDDFMNKVESKAPKEPKKKEKGGLRRALFIIFKPYDMLFIHFVPFFALAMAFAFLGIIAGYTFDYTSLLLKNNAYLSLIFAVIFLMLIIAFMVLFMQKLYRVSFMQEKIIDINFNKKVFVKAYGLTWVFFALSMLPILSFVILYKRVPNPNWIYELSVFTFYAILAVIPFVSIRYFVCYAFLFRNKKVPPLGLIWEKTGDNIRGILLSFMCILLFMMMFFARSMGIAGADGTFWRYFAAAVFGALIIFSGEVQRLEFFDSEKK